MRSPGFELRDEKGQVILDLIMPELLRRHFRVTLYGRGPLFDSAQGDPSLIWAGLDERGKHGGGLVAPIQEHGVTVLDAVSDCALPVRPKADGVYLDTGSECGASLRFADCAPVVIASASGSPWMLVLHSGYVGTVKNISGQALAEALAKNPGAKTDELCAWIAPAICSECYTRRLDDPATRKGMDLFSEDNYWRRGDFVHFDIKNEIKRCIMERGVLPENIFTSEICPCCENERFYSYRAGDRDCRNFLLAVNTTKTVC